MDMNNRKIFVGNVPFQCDINEFQQCFKNLYGFVRAELVCRQNSNLSRGFGFVIFDSPENASKLIGREDIKFMNRTLRFTKYDFNIISDTSNVIQKSHDKQFEITKNKFITPKNYIFVKNLNSSISRENLKSIFDKFGNVGKHMIISDHNTGILKNTGIVEILDDNVYDILLKQKYIDIENNILELCKWKFQKVQKYNNGLCTLKK